MSLVARFISAIVALIVVACTAVSGAVVWDNLNESERILQQQGLLIASLLASEAGDNPRTAVDEAVSNPQVYAAALYDANFNAIADQTASNAPVGLPPVTQLQALVAANKATGAPSAIVNDRTMFALDDVDAPNPSALNAAPSAPVIKFAVVTLSTAAAIDSLANSVHFAFWVTIALAILAAVVAYFISRRALRPISALGRATADLEAGDFKPETLESARKRGDELGRLARRFTGMAEEVQQRQQQSSAQLAALQVQIDETDRRQSVETITGTAEFADLSQRATALRARRTQQEQQ